jgi:hypothetical protein
LDAVTLQDLQELCLEGLLLVMLRLLANVCDREIDLPNPDAEGTISFLPREVAMLSERFVNPFRGAVASGMHKFALGRGGVDGSI